MTEEERRELEELKSRQADLLGQLARLGHRLEAFERRISASPATQVPSAPKAEPIARAVQPPPAVVAPPPPIIPPQFQPP
ncbi:MAG: hypothetical protein JWQ04_187, partial [Pedosphaera sp.]|nr:hypothetical protein [Pedosphaera sp.]